MLNPFIYSLRNKDTKRVLKCLFEIETINGMMVPRPNMCP
jgi:hypothetical protein